MNGPKTGFRKHLLEFNGEDTRAVGQIKTCGYLLGMQMSPKQTEIYYELLSGKSYLEIAEKMNISTETVKTHCRAIYKHFEVKNQKRLMGLVLQTQEVTRPETIRQLSREANSHR